MSLRSLAESVSRLFGDDLNIQDRLESLYVKLSQLDEIQALANMPGWQKMSVSLRATNEELSRLIVELSAEPVKNEKRIIYCRAQIDAIYALLGIVDATDQKCQSVMRDIDDKLMLIEDAAKRGMPIS